MQSWRDNLRRVTPYVPGEQPDKKKVIKLNTNENPYPPAPAVMKAREKIRHLRRYPDPTASSLVRAIAGYHGLKESQVFVGVGSDDVLALSFLTFFNSDKAICFPDITYSFYDVWADLFRIPYEQKALDERFHIRVEDYYPENGGVIFPNPNAPTGILMPLSRIRDLLDHNRDVVVIIDEAYIDFGGTSALPLIDEYDNLLIVRTFSKSRSMAGVRIGYALGSEDLIRGLNDVKGSFNSYTMNQPSLVLGEASLKEESYFRDTLRKIIETREWLKEELLRLGFCFPDSKANFVFASHSRVPARDIFEAARKKDIYVRYFDRPRIDQYLRITVGTREEMELFVDFLEDYLFNINTGKF